MLHSRRLSLFLSSENPSISSITITHVPPYYANIHVRDALKAFPDLFEKGEEWYEWFKSEDHFNALCFLVNNDEKKKTLDEAFSELERLNDEQARGIAQGLSRQEVEDLNSIQINAILKHGLEKEEVVGLNQIQIEIFLLWREQLSHDELRKYPEFNTTAHLVFLNYLINMHQFSVTDALEKLKDLGFRLLELLKNLHPWGLQIQHIKQYEMLKIPQFQETLDNLLRRHAYKIDDALDLLKKLTVLEESKALLAAKALALGLDSDAVQGLSNEYQIIALAQLATKKNGLSRNHFLNNDWFNSQEHVYALQYLLGPKNFMVEEAMLELKDLTPEQAKALANGEKRDNIIGLTPPQYDSVRQLKYHGLTGSHLRDKKDWSKNHHLALTWLLDQKKIKLETALYELKEMNSYQAQLRINYSKEVIDKLSDIQIKILCKQRKLHLPERLVLEVLEATWLNTKEQYSLFKVLFKKFTSMVIINNALTLIQIAEKREGGIEKFITQINENLLTINDLKELIVDYKKEQNKELIPTEETHSCKIM